VRITWSSVSGATYYKVYRATSSGGTRSQIGSPTSTSFDDTTASAGTTYYYWVRASNSYGDSGYSSYNTGYRAVPGPPVISNIRHDYYGFVDWCVSSSGGTFSGHLYDVYFDYSDPDGNAAESDGAWVTVNGVTWSWADIGGDGYDGTVDLSYCNSSPGVSLYIYMYDGDEQRSNQLSITLTED
jgi:hypothetical protein